MNTIQTFRQNLQLGAITYTIETKSTNPLIAKAKFQLLEKIIRNGTQRQIIFSEPKST